MPTLKEITDDLKLIIQKSTPSDDFRITSKWLQRHIAKYRARGIRETYLRSREINLNWLQELGNIGFTRVTPDDDPNIAGCDCILGKYVIPTAVGLPDDKGVYRVSSACRTKKFYPTTLERFMGFVKGTLRGNQRYYFRIGNSLYVHPFLKEGSVQMIMNNPLDGYVIQSTNILTGNLIVGEVYVISSGSIVHNDLTYSKGMTFTAASSTFAGNGLVKFNEEKRMMKATDDYPLDDTMMEYILVKILSQELRIESAGVADTRNDSQDEAERAQPRR